jgi:hypothetical protein
VLWVILLAAGAAGVVLGAVRGEAQDVMRKAITVCLECIGIG